MITRVVRAVLVTSGKVHDLVDIFVYANSCSHCSWRSCLFLALLAGGGAFTAAEVNGQGYTQCTHVVHVCANMWELYTNVSTDGLLRYMYMHMYFIYRCAHQLALYMKPDKYSIIVGEKHSVLYKQKILHVHVQT